MTCNKAFVSIPTRAGKTGLDHLGIQAEGAAELEELGSRLANADLSILPQKGAACCYARSDKYWTIDPQGVPWESFHTLEAAPVYGEDRAARVEQAGGCCAPNLGAVEEKKSCCP